MNRNLLHKRRGLLITRYVAAKFAAYTKIAGTDEFMVLLLGLKKLKDVVVDIFLLRDQRVTSASVEVSGHGINRSLWEMQEKYSERQFEILGWGHSHGYGSVFHSSTDDKTSKEVFLEQLAPLRLVAHNRKVVEELTPNEHGEIILSPESGGHIKFLNLAGEKPPAKIRIEKNFPEYHGLIFSVVTNFRNEFYCEKFTRIWCPHCDRVSLQKEVIPINIVKLKKRWRIDAKKLSQEFQQKVIRCKVVWSILPGRTTYFPQKDGWGYYDSRVSNCEEIK